MNLEQVGEQPMPVWMMGANLHSPSTEGAQHSVNDSAAQLNRSLDQLKVTAEVLGQVGNLVNNVTEGVDNLTHTATDVIHVVGAGVAHASTVISSGMKESDIVGQLSSQGAAVRLEKATLGSIKGIMTLTYGGTAWLPGQIICGIVGLGMIAVSGVDYLRGKSDTRFGEGASLAIAPSRWLANMVMSTYNDIKEAYTGKGSNNEDLKALMGDQSFVATFASLEAEIGGIFQVDGREARSIEKKVAGLVKGVLAFEVGGTYVPALVISTILGVTAMGSSYYNGQSVQQGGNIVASPALAFGALLKSAYHDFFGK